MGGQTALNTALDLVREGVLEKFNVEMIGASQRAIDMAEDRELFRRAMADIGLETARARIAHSMEEALAVQSEIGFPTVIRPSFTLGGSGGGIAYNREEFEAIVARGLDASPTNEVLLEESVLGWKEYEMEVVRDRDRQLHHRLFDREPRPDGGAHRGFDHRGAGADPDRPRVPAPARRLDRGAAQDRRRHRRLERAVRRQSGRRPGAGHRNESARVALLGARIQGDRVSRSPRSPPSWRWATRSMSSRMKSPAARTPASFEPTIDYVVTKIPRFTFEKFPGSNTRLTTQMKSVGEAMAIGRTFQESMQKALRSLETGYDGFNEQLTLPLTDEAAEKLSYELRWPGPNRILYVADAFRAGWTLQQVFDATKIDPWFLAQIEDLLREEAAAGARTASKASNCRACAR